MGQTSSQLLASTHHAEDTRPSRTEMQYSRAGSPLESEINVMNPRSKSIIGTSPMMSPKTTQKRKRDDEHGAKDVDVPKKKKMRKIRKGSGRPRDPSLLKKSVTTADGVQQSDGVGLEVHTNVEQGLSRPDLGGTNADVVNKNVEARIEDTMVRVNVRPWEVEEKHDLKKAKKRREKKDGTQAEQSAHPDGHRISLVGQRGPRSRRQSRAGSFSRPNDSERYRPSNDPAAQLSSGDIYGDGQQLAVSCVDPDMQKNLPEPHAAVDPPVVNRYDTGNHEENIASADEVLAELEMLIKELRHLTRKKIPDKHVRLSLMHRSLTCIGDYLYTWLAQDDDMISHIWEQIAQTAWPRHNGPQTTGESLLRVYREQTKDDEGLRVRRTPQGEGDRVAKLIREEIEQHERPPSGSPAVLPQAVPSLIPQCPATDMRVVEPRPAMTPPGSNPKDNTLREPSGSFNEGVRGVAGWVEAHDEGAADPNIASPRRERAQKTAPPDNKPAVVDLNIGRALPVTLPHPLESGPSSGLFSAAEKAVADDVFDYVCQRNQFDLFEFRASTIDWRNVAPEFKVELAAALPKRTSRALRKFAMRRYRPKKDGAFDKEEDERLVNAVAEYGQHWQDVADIVGDRTADQCRDRYRLILQYGDDRAVGPWSQEEEATLVTIVHEVMEQIRQANIDKGDIVNEDSEVQRMINWETVATKMSSRRSRKRCSEKWTQLVARNHGQLPIAQTATAAAQAPIAEYDGHSKKQRAVNKKYDMFAIGDVYDVLEEIASALEDRSKVYSHESTVWAIITSKNQESRFTGPLRRKAYHDALETYGQKGKISKQTTIAGKAAAMIAYLDGYAKRKKIEQFERAYMPEKRKPKAKPQARPAMPTASLPASPVVRQAPERVKPSSGLRRSEAAPRSGRNKRPQFLSAEKVEDSDAEAEDDEVVDAKPALLDNPDADYTEAERKNIDEDNDMNEDNDRDDGADQQILAIDPPAHENAKVPVIPETQQEQAVAGAQAAPSALDDAVTVSSLNSRWNRRVARPSLGADEFMARCRRAGRRQHAAYTAT
ncbi:hypothetical protein LTR78_010511 [Recurvomyces mirabilis]|uniref:Uncharacterized protein n=1 Tax=Recurvomyces mirabilis TaxID=574656 RepID=A0AAE0WF20_9PEZI|nr:hypothetical protein LTR78_010511 [Recurvomyces mirabilis]KAK5151694.1 hypothetical protein LTS14_009181 [Recurvomyces mirabilis]